MSKAFLNKFGNKGFKREDMRKWCQRPGRRNEKGEIQYFTQQNHKRECDVNMIIAKYDKQGLITHVNKLEARYGDCTGADFRKAQDLYINAQKMFDNLPAEIKKRFSQSAGEFLEFMENPENREEAIELGLIRQDSMPEKDGLGEHVKADDYEGKKDEKSATKSDKKEAKTA